MKWAIFVLGLIAGSMLTYAILDVNFREFTEPKEELGRKLRFCDLYGQKAMNMPHNWSERAYLNASRDYFLCIREAYGFEYDSSQ